MKYSRLLIVLTMILSWSSIAFVGKGSLRRFLPSCLLMGIIVKIVNMIAKKRRWWWWYEKIHPSVSGEFPFVWGSFFATSLWVLKWTYGKFIKYLGLNLIVHSGFTYGLEPYLQKFGIASLVRLNKIQLMYVFMSLAILLYGFQMVNERKTVPA